MIQITHDIAIADSEITEEFIRASGPGGQNVNKVASAVQLRFDVRRSPSLPEGVKERLEKLAGKKVTTDGVLIIDARRFRTQQKNREDALNRLVELIRRATIVPKVRKKKRLSGAAKLHRRQEKKIQSEKKRARRFDFDGDE